MAINCFDSEWSKASKKMLFELRPTTQWNVLHKGVQKDVNSIKTCLKVLKECRDNVPRFVSHLDELSPVTFTNLDVCSLLRKVEQLHTEVSAMKSALQLQAEISESLCSVVVDVSHRVTVLEKSADHSSTGLIALMRRPDMANASTVAVSGVDGSSAGTGSAAPRGELCGGQLHSLPPLSVEGATSAVTLGQTTSPKWTRVVERGQQKRTEAANAKQGLRAIKLPMTPWTRSFSVKILQPFGRRYGWPIIASSPYHAHEM